MTSIYATDDKGNLLHTHEVSNAERLRGAYKMTSQPTCEERIKDELEGRMYDIRKLWALYRQDCEAYDEDLGRWNEYGLSFDYVAAHTFGEDQNNGYFRYQLSWGGPSDEFRFYVGMDHKPITIQYWFMDWFDGAMRELHGEDFELLAEILADFDDMGMLETEYNKALTE